MPTGTLLLIGRQTAESLQPIQTHAARLRDRNVADTVRVETYDETWDESVGGNAPEDGDELVLAVPLTIAYTNETRHVIPSIARRWGETVSLCTPIGHSPALTEIIAERADERVARPEETSLLLVGLGSGSLSDQRRTVEYHERRLRDRTAYDEVRSCYVLQDPVVECARYNVSNEAVVAVPMFVAPSPVTKTTIPEKLDIDRSGIDYADPIGTHERLTDAIQADVARHSALDQSADDGGGSDRVSCPPAVRARPVVTDGQGPSE
ncbi:sirohydrochlorin chelatase [Haloarcula sp. S1AR25-5A]|uniref:Sirohydrochlorin chelatase n=1 Tax=Haloarcula terrestris TaxID=2950533 RepID=A0AAE4EUS5_9EURY|nr:CbiX/SirB N-terminal domain-containing protein [Haloarcula terrestris]MDS0220570.1 sirohydrochlorin chelatase [Haloarcula terrestris]